MSFTSEKVVTTSSQFTNVKCCKENAIYTSEIPTNSLLSCIEVKLLQSENNFFEELCVAI